MKFLLDTDICIFLLNGRHARLAQRLAEHDADDVVLSVITEAELWYGIARSERPAHSRAQLERLTSAVRVLPFDRECAREAGHVRGHLARLGTPIGPYDSLIAGHALARGLTLVTHNTREFSRVPRLEVEDWVA